ncbi:MAG: sigma-70 family RNA polymerase sigma factor [Leptolyngbyaceae cyanobacterium MO_188.B28]|nr:sigma-70 family RNA polymerase sigma factor [Leptolyngbyaceae cyanobacterium MO_188.B28]
MRPRQDIIESFSTFIQFSDDCFSRWVPDPKLQRSMRQCLTKSPESPASGNFWALYWHKLWRGNSSKLAGSHLSAYLQEACYWAAQKTISSFKSLQYTVSDCFQTSIIETPKILQGFQPVKGVSLNAYARVVFSNVIRNVLRQHQEVDICSNWALLSKVSQKRFVEALQQGGLGTETIARYRLAWFCFKQCHSLHKAAGTRQLPKPDKAIWQAISELYNAERQTQLTPPDPACSPATLETWLAKSAELIRSYLYPAKTSLNLPKSGWESTELQDDLPNNPDSTLDQSLLAELIAQEETEARQSQKAQMNTALRKALVRLDVQKQQMLRLYYAKGLTQQQIAQQLDIKQYTVSRRLRQAREALLLALANWSQTTLHISPDSNVIRYISTALEEWLQGYYDHPDPDLSERSS